MLTTALATPAILGVGEGGGWFPCCAKANTPPEVLRLGQGLAHQYETVDGRIQQELREIHPREATASATITTGGAESCET